MSLTYLSDRCTAGLPDPAEVIAITLGDKTFRAGRRTAAHIKATIDNLAHVYPTAHLHVIQPCYNTGVAASAGTHDGDGVLDFSITGLTWEAAERFLREEGWAAWWRHTGEWRASSRWHLHGVSIGCPGPVGIYVPAQVDDYYRHALGLAGQHTSGDDPSWHPADINSTVFDYPAWITAQEDDMPFTEAQLSAIVSKAIEDATPAIAEAVLDFPVGKDGANLRQVVNQTRTAVKRAD